MKCNCIDNQCPNTCFHKQFESKYTTCYFQWTCECDCGCPNRAENDCNLCHKESLCNDCVKKIIVNGKEFSISQFECLPEILTSILEETIIDYCMICKVDDVKCYLSTKGYSVCKKCHSLLRSSL